MRSVQDILTLDELTRKTDYKADNIHKVIIDGNEFTDYAAYSFLWEKTFVESPSRSGNGSMGDLNTYATFVTAHLKIDFSLMSIDAYRKIMQLIYSKNEFNVTCYDVVNNETVTRKMYFATEEMPKLWTIARNVYKAINNAPNASGETLIRDIVIDEDNSWIEVLGVQEYSVEMIGTNNDDVISTIHYHYNSPITGTSDIEDSSQKFENGEPFAVKQYTDFSQFNLPTGYTFSTWNTKSDGSGLSYTPGETMFSNTAYDMHLYARYTYSGGNGGGTVTAA